MDERKKQKIEIIKKSFALKREERYKEAIEVLYKALEYNDNSNDDIEILSQIGDLHICLKNYDRAIDEFQKVLSIIPNHTYSLEKSFEIYFIQKQYKKALKLITKMCENNKTAFNYLNYFKVLIALDKPQDAIEIFNSLDDKLKLDVDLLYLISTISPEEKKPLILKKIISIDETHEKANLDLVKIEFDNKNYNKVVSYCLNIVDDNAYVNYYLAKVESVRLNHSKAIEYFIKAIKLNDEILDIYFDLAKSYIDVCWFDEAFLALKKSINYSISKNETINLDEKHFLCAWILIKQKQYSKAKLSINSIDKKSNFYSQAQILKQVINFNNSNISDVILKLEKLYENEKENIILLDTLALAYKELKLYKKAIEIYQIALENYPNSIYYLLELIDLLIDNKDYSQALEKIELFNKTYNDCPAIFNSLARIYYRLKEFDKALLALDEYLKLDNNNAEQYYFKGLVLNDLNRFNEAKESIYNAIKINPTIAKYYNQMSRSYIGLKEYDNALLYSKEAIEIDPNEINFKKQAYEIAILLDDKKLISLYKKQLDRSISILKRR